MRKILLALLSLFLAQPLLAQAFPQPSETKPSDVSAYSYVAPLWTTDGTENGIVDPNSSPPPQLGLTEVNPITNTTGMIGTFNGVGATFTGASISGTILTVPNAPTGTIKVGDVVYGSGLPSGEGPSILAYGTGSTTGNGGTGTYTIGVNVGTVAIGGITGTTSPNFCLTTASGITGGTCTQAKFRTQANIVKVLPDDPIRGFCQPGNSHLHEFFGNLSTNACSTYASLRNRCASHAAGYCLNGTGYWFPAPIKTNPFGDGSNYAVRANRVIVYYLQNSPSLSATTAKIPRGLRYIFGRNMDDPENTQFQKYLNTLNALDTNHSRYQVVSPTTGNFDNQAFYTCVTVGSSNVLTNADGTDPFGGACTAGKDLYINLSGASCWDRTNLWSPGGYSHLVKAAYDNTFNKSYCPKNYSRLPQLVQEIHFAQQGFSDYGAWRLSSDDSMQTKLDGFSICASDLSNAPCAYGATFNGHISGTTLTVNSVSVGAMRLTTTIGVPGEAGHNGYQIEGSGITGHPIIEAQLTGTAGQAGTYTLGGTFSCSGACASDGALRASEYAANGESIHEDWLFGWDNATIESWETGCVGTLSTSTPHECDSSQITSGNYLLGGYTGEKLPDNYILTQDTTMFPTTSASTMYKIARQPNGPMTMPVNH